MQVNGAQSSLHLGRGFTWAAALQVLPTPQTGRKTLAEISASRSRLTITIGLDGNDDLRVWVVDALGKQQASDPFPREHFFLQDKVLLVSLIPVSGLTESTSEELALTVLIEDETGFAVTTRLSLSITSPLELDRLTVGSTAEGKEKARFYLSRLVVYDGFIEDADKPQVIEEFTAALSPLPQPLAGVAG